MYKYYNTEKINFYRRLHQSSQKTYFAMFPFDFVCAPSVSVF